MIFRQPRHAWRGIHYDRTGLWPVLTLGWWTWDFLPGGVHARLAEMVRELRKRKS